MNRRVLRFGLSTLAASCLFLGGCATRGGPDNSPVPPPDLPRPQAKAKAGAPDQDRSALADHLKDLDAKIAKLEDQASRPVRQGSGAYAQWTSLRVEGGGREPVLDRLRRLEQDLVVAKATITAKEAQVRDLQIARADAESSGKLLAEKADYLGHTRDSLQAAQQTLAERQEKLDQVAAQLAASELQRLRSERDFYRLAGEVLRMTQDQTSELPDIQNRIRQQTRDLQTPAKGAGK